MKDTVRSQPAEAGTGLPRWGRGGLNLRLVGLLSLVLFPLALVAALQSQRAVDAGLASYRASLAAQTAAAARPERDAILDAFATAAALADTLSVLRPGAAECVALMQEIAAANPRLSFVGHVAPTRQTVCNNMDDAFDFSGNPATADLYADPRTDVTFNPSGGASRMAVVIVSQPVYLDDGTFDGFISISFPAASLVQSRPAETDDPDLQILTFNDKGEVLTSDVTDEDLATLLPAGLDLSSLAGRGRQIFTAPSRTGMLRDFAAVPIIDDRAYALGSAPASTAPGFSGVPGGPAVFWPILMWLASLLVAVLVLRRQVIVPIRQLRMRMRSFADGRAILKGDTMTRAPSELREIGHTFDTMADQILHDEAELENRLHERELLLREVHHRVKNNLQLMSSIINMQIRQSGSAEAEEALRRVQGRLASLAKFHRDLYQSSSLVELRADELLADLARQLMSVALDPGRPIDLTLDLAPVRMSPDQVSPLAMLVTEAMTNAMKYARTEDGTRPFVRLGLEVDNATDPGIVTVCIENSVREDDALATIAGLGTQLIRAFAVQLDAEVEKGRTDGTFSVSVSFPLEPFRHEDGTVPAP